MNLSNLKPAVGSVKSSKRIGRGTGSGKGGTSTRGHKGAQSRSGYSRKAGFEGGQMPLQRRLPKFGFKNISRVEYKPVNIEMLQVLADKHSTTVIDLAFLQAHGIATKNDLIKVLGKNGLTSKLQVIVHKYSKSAIAAIEKVGGTASKL